MDNEKKIVDSPHSVKIAINQKGNFSGEVKMYGTTPEEAMQRATEKANELKLLIRTQNAL